MLKVADHFATVAAMESAMQGGINGVTEESNRTVAERDHCTTRMKAARCEEAGEMDHEVRDTAVGRAVSVGQRADGT